ncbi:MAG TPA: tetratricopeptide repeat protein [Acidobacteriota bacterium]|nr:tetratricopeptide repeat protein [Acidobacteriota bacterium]
MLNVAELDERIEKCLAILAENPRSQVFAALADSYRKRGDFGRAFSVCKSGLKQHPDYAPAHIVLAKLYLHQGMPTEAHAVLTRAIELDGPTRASDLLQAEILIAMGNVEGARAAVERLRRGDPRNPAIAELRNRIKACAAEKKHASVKTSPSPDAVTVAPSAPPSPEIAALGRSAPLTWGEWAADLAAVPSVEHAFSVDAEGAILAGVTDDEDATAATVADMFAQIDAALHAKLGIDLQELRIERSDAQLWCRRRDRGVIGFVGSAGVPFGAARQTAVTGAERVTPAAGDKPAANGEVA